MKQEKTEKSIVRIYRNGKSVHQMEFLINVKPTKKGDKFIVTERRHGFKDEKIIFSGEESAAKEFFENQDSSTVINKGILGV